ncbi:MAG: hypothetical protein EXX96DRAFT_549580 [Benjaminiella poitrasii]|nr:MAG: hypothetical protein EXX96DRAFT_549580 [Benjaminiella poitrasii]
MKTTILTNAENTIVLQHRRPSDILEESYVAQNISSNDNSRKNSFSSATTTTGELNSYHALPTTASPTTDASVNHHELVNAAFWPISDATNTTTNATNMGSETFSASQPNSVIHPLDSNLIFQNWNSSPFPAHTIKQEEWSLQELQPQRNTPFLSNSSSVTSTTPLTTTNNNTTTNNTITSLPESNNNSNNNQYVLNNMIPHTPNMPEYGHTLPLNHFGYTSDYPIDMPNVQSAPPSMVNTTFSTPNSGLVTPPMPNYFNSRHSLPANMINTNMNIMSLPLENPKTTTRKNRRNSSNDTRHHQRSYSKRNPSHPSVASVVSLTAHEPVSKMINGIEHITFLYSHDRLVKEYTVRTDVYNVNINDIDPEFRMQNAIYPRANVHRDEYDGNRWDYETSCNELGWKLCWLNNDQLTGRRGLIQRAVDSYRNRHAEMRSRRVTRQEKVANGTLRKRRSKKSSPSNYTM